MITRTISVPGFRIGTAQDRVGLTGVTVILAPEGGATAGVDVRGCAPGTRETDLLSPEKTVQQIHAVVLSGGSAFGLEADSGVMNALAEDGVGFPVGPVSVPIVCGALRPFDRRSESPSRSCYGIRGGEAGGCDISRRLLRCRDRCDGRQAQGRRACHEEWCRLCGDLPRKRTLCRCLHGCQCVRRSV